MITRLKLSTIEQGLPKYRSMLAGNAAYVPSSYESIASTTGTGSSTTITFSSIPSTYQSLQIRFNELTTSGGVSADSVLYLRINGVSSSGSYMQHYLEGNGASVYAGGGTFWGTSEIVLGAFDGTPIGGTYPAAGIIDIHDYTSTTRNKTIRSFWGGDKNGSGDILLTSGLFINTAAVSSISIRADYNFTTSSTFALYGIKGA